MSLAELNLDKPKTWLNPVVNSIKIGSTGTTLSTYEQYLLTGTVSGPWASPQSCNIRLTLDGDRVHVYVPAVLATTNGAAVITSTVAVPTRFRPTNFQEFDYVVLSNSTKQAGLVTIFATGLFIWYLNLAGDVFPNTVDAGFISSTFTYSLY